MTFQNMHNPRYQFASDHTLLVTFGDELSDRTHQDVVRITRLLLDQPRGGILNIHPAYTSVLITFNPMKVAPTEVEQYLHNLVTKINAVVLPEPRTIEIPVCYGGKFGPDLVDVAKHNNLTPDEVIRLHTSVNYTVYFLGFTPGFPYLGGMPKQIATPRLVNPRTNVPAGSVAIGGSQTGIYPISSPGGWRIIGRTSLQLFRADRNPPTLLQMGDGVKFVFITQDEFKRLAQSVGVKSSAIGR